MSDFNLNIIASYMDDTGEREKYIAKNEIYLYILSLRTITLN